MQKVGMSLESENSKSSTMKENNVKSNLSDSITKLKNYNPLNFFKQEAFVDVYDENKSWRVAKIQEISNDNFLTILFDGWSEKWNEVTEIILNQSFIFLLDS
jgi:hypothetical protein